MGAPREISGGASLTLATALYTHILLCYRHGITKSVSAVLVLALKK